MLASLSACFNSDDPNMQKVFSWWSTGIQHEKHKLHIIFTPNPHCTALGWSTGIPHEYNSVLWFINNQNVWESPCPVPVYCFRVQLKVMFSKRGVLLDKQGNYEDNIILFFIAAAKHPCFKYCQSFWNWIVPVPVKHVCSQDCKPLPKHGYISFKLCVIISVNHIKWIN